MPILTAEERIGTTIADRYEVLSVLGQGGMGVVLEGRHVSTGRKIAIKLLLPTLCSDALLMKRFFQEARAAAALDHPNVIEVLDVGRTVDGQAYLVLEFLEGEDLNAKLTATKTLTLEETLEILLPIMDALGVAHDRGIVHRDIKPDNIFLARDARGRVTPKLLDFGIAKLTENPMGPATKTGHVVGTPQYMSPEQAGSGEPISAATDIWAIGVLLYECLAGKMPHNGQTLAGLLLAIVMNPPPPLSKSAPGVPEAIEQAIMKSLEKKATDRFASMDDFIAALRGSDRRTAPTLIEDPNPVAPTPAQETPVAFAKTIATVDERSGASTPDPLAVTQSPQSAFPKWALALVATTLLVGIGAASVFRSTASEVAIPEAAAIPESAVAVQPELPVGQALPNARLFEPIEREVANCHLAKALDGDFLRGALTTRFEGGSVAEVVTENEGLATCVREGLSGVRIATDEESHVFTLPPPTTVLLRSEPSGSDVYINDARMGETPFPLVVDPDGTTVEVRRRGYERAGSVVRQGAGEVTVTLRRTRRGRTKMSNGVPMLAPQ